MNIISHFRPINQESSVASRHYSSPETQRSQNRSIVLKYAYFQTVCTKNTASVKWSYFAQKCIEFHLQPSRFEKKIFREEKPRTLYYRCGKGKGR